MSPPRFFLLFLSAFFFPAAGFCFQAEGEPRLVVTVSNQFGFPIKDLKAEDFIVTHEKAARPVQSARYVTDALVDTVLLLDTSEVGARVKGEIEHVAALFIERLGEKEQMAIVGYASSADLAQDFTSSKTLLKRAVGSLKYGNRPALLDSVYAVVDGAFERAAGRRVLVVIGSGLDWRSRVDRREVIRLAGRNAVSVFAISFAGDGDLEKITEETAGDFYGGRELRQIRQVAENLTAAFRGHYELALPGAALNAGKVKVEVRRTDKLRVSFRLARQYLQADGRSYFGVER